MRVGFEAKIQLAWNVGSDMELLVGVWEHYDYSSWNAKLVEVQCLVPPRICRHSPIVWWHPLFPCTKTNRTFAGLAIGILDESFAITCTSWPSFRPGWKPCSSKQIPRQTHGQHSSGSGGPWHWDFPRRSELDVSVWLGDEHRGVLFKSKCFRGFPVSLLNWELGEHVQV